MNNSIKKINIINKTLLFGILFIINFGALVFGAELPANTTDYPRDITDADAYELYLLPDNYWDKIIKENYQKEQDNSKDNSNDNSKDNSNDNSKDNWDNNWKEFNIKENHIDGQYWDDPLSN